MVTIESTARDIVIPVTGGSTLRGWFWTRPHARAVLVISHGFGEHGGCYRHVAEALGPALGIDVLAPDFRGHGRSPGRRGVVGRYEDLVADLHGALDWAARARPGLPLFVLGHSNGGLVALFAALHRGDALAGLILSNPSIRLATRVPRYKTAIGKVLLRFAPNVTLPASLATERMTRDPDMQREHRLDRLRHGRMSAPLYFGMVDGGRAVAARAAEIRLPLLVVLGAADDVTDPEATRALFEAAASADKTLLIYPKMLHEPLNELGREQVITDLAAWLKRHLDQPSA